MYHTNAILIFLAACLAITVGTLFVIHGLTDLDLGLVVVFTVLALGVVAVALVAMDLVDRRRRPWQIGKFPRTGIWRCHD